MQPGISLEDVLNIKYLGKWNWSPDGRFIAYIWDDGGLHDIWLVQPGVSEPKKLSDAKKGVTDFAWEPKGAVLWFIQDGALRYFDAKDQSSLPQTVYSSASSIAGLSWSPDGTRLAFSKEGKIWLSDQKARCYWELSLPGRVVPLGSQGSVSWSPSSKRFALSFRDEETYLQIAVTDRNGKVIWRSFLDGPSYPITWLDDDSLLFAKPNSDGTSVRVLALDLGDLPEKTPGGADLSETISDDQRKERRRDQLKDQLKDQRENKTVSDERNESGGATEEAAIRQVYLIQGTGRGGIMGTQVVLSPDRRRLLFLLENDGWMHCYLAELDEIKRGAVSLRQVTFGQCEDFGHAGDQPAFWPDSRSFVYASNRDSRGERYLYRYYLDSGTSERVVGLPGQNTMPKVSCQGKMAFVHCDAFKNMDIWVLEEDEPRKEDGLGQGNGPKEGDGPRQVTFSMPSAWTKDNQYVPEEISFESAGHLTIYGYLMKPRHISPGERLPALVWVHGGPVRQMRPGWHPLRSYALFHGFNQYLVDRGYVVLEVNYRGGIGYGRDFREALFHKMGIDDVSDVCNAGLYLKGLPYVDQERVGVWGLSYGGYATLHCLAKRPEVFRVGVNIAGIWDFPQWTRWAEKRYGRGPGLFKVYLGGDPETSKDLYRQASPKTFVQGMKAPLLNVQGTADANVDFDQMNSIIKDCVEHGKYHEVIYYPSEVHTFAKKKTWLDAMPKIEAFIGRFLKDGE